jgi:CRISPR/Cas system-associated endoribonuclease Cas2
MPVIVTYDLKRAPVQDRNYLRSMFERFGWKRVGGSVLRYDGEEQADGSMQEDWLNCVAPALMFFRSYVLEKKLKLTFFTIDAASTSFLDNSDPIAMLGRAPEAGTALPLVAPICEQSAAATIRKFVDATATASGALAN